VINDTRHVGQTWRLSATSRCQCQLPITKLAKGLHSDRAIGSESCSENIGNNDNAIDVGTSSLKIN
jgi:hypothetical protein